MIDKRVLDKAKSYLSWDLQEPVSIQLVAIDRAVAYFYPPQNKLSSIIVLYEGGCNDFSRPLFLLFHEMGHHIQYNHYQNEGRSDQYWQLLNADSGMMKCRFEEEAWEYGAELLGKFAKDTGSIRPETIQHYRHYAEECVSSYR